jgi:hypothetical protein
MTRLGVLASLLGVLLSLSVALARQGVVKTRNGQTYEGEVEEKAGVVTVTNRGIQTRIAQSDVASLSYPEDFDKQFAAKLAKLEKGDSRGRIALAREAFNNGRYKLSRDVLEEVLASDPNNAEAAELRDTVMAQIRLERLKQNPATAEARAERPATTQATTMAAENLLKARDINIIRQQEMRLDLSGDAIVEADRNIPIRFEKDANRRYARQASNRPAGQFLALSALDQAREMYRQGPREMRDDIKIMRDPQTMLEVSARQSSRT